TSDIQAWMGGPKEEELEAFLAGQERWQPMMANGGMNIINALTGIWWDSQYSREGALNDFLEVVLCREIRDEEWDNAKIALARIVNGT
ncbi:hypothetical protein HQ544_03850, partial [Candidatus Falkowbacteria bacterium]|nr:hypothetical protein [Candidatus Falkowbacteria bacterium]